MRQILTNFVSNAIKFTEVGSVDIVCRSRDGLAHVDVIDTGIGIAPDDLARLFRPFEQVHKGLGRIYEGTGLGLYVSRSLADLLKGKVSAKSEAGQGSTFTLSLPLAEK